VSILVTGVNGMIGYPMALKFAKLRRQVIGLDIEIPSELEKMGIQLIKGDITQADLLNDVIASNRVNSILHAGGISGPMLYRDDPYKVFDVNSNGTLNIAEAARRNDVKRIVFLSSFVAYGEQKDRSIVAESRMQYGSNSYAASKISAENILRSYREIHKLETVSLRLGAVYGPRRTTDCLVHRLIKNSINDEVL
jgi:nucleoside-diphosphate-sugar epimerase